MERLLSPLRQLSGWINPYIRKIPDWAVYLLGVLPFIGLIYAAFTNALGAQPIKELEHELGELSMQFLMIGLAITPLRKHLALNLMKFRRAVGLVTFFYIFMHFLVWMVLDVQILDQIWADILKRPYVAVGFASFVIMLPLAITSNNWSVRKLGRRWRGLHKLVYAAAILAGVHHLMLVKGIQLDPIIDMAIILGLLALRVNFKRFAARTSSA